MGYVTTVFPSKTVIFLNIIYLQVVQIGIKCTKMCTNIVNICELLFYKCFQANTVLSYANIYYKAVICKGT